MQCVTQALYDTLDGQVALVAGTDCAAGAAAADELVALGATVYAASGTGDSDSISISDAATPLTLDFGDEASIAAAVKRVIDECDRLDVLVLVPASDRGEWNLLETATDGLDVSLTRNLRGPLLLVRAALPYLLERDGGRVLVVSDTHTPTVRTDRRSRASEPVIHVATAALTATTTYLHDAFAPRLIANTAEPGTARADGGPRGASESSAETVAWLARFEPGSDGGRAWRDRRPVV